MRTPWHRKVQARDQELALTKPLPRLPHAPQVMRADPLGTAGARSLGAALRVIEQICDRVAEGTDSSGSDEHNQHQQQTVLHQILGLLFLPKPHQDVLHLWLPFIFGAWPKIQDASVICRHAVYRMEKHVAGQLSAKPSRFC